VHKRAVAHERGIQRGEGPVKRGGICAEMLANEILTMVTTWARLWTSSKKGVERAG